MKRRLKYYDYANPIFVIMDVSFINSRFMDFPVGCRWLYIWLWNDCALRKRKKVKINSYYWLAQNSGLQGHDIEKYIKLLQEFKMINVIDENIIELPGLFFTQAQFDHKTGFVFYNKLPPRKAAFKKDEIKKILRDQEASQYFKEIDKMTAQEKAIDLLCHFKDKYKMRFGTAIDDNGRDYTDSFVGLISRLNYDTVGITIDHYYTLPDEYFNRIKNPIREFVRNFDKILDKVIDKMLDDDASEGGDA